MSGSPRKRIVLLGAGHAHLYTLKRLRAFIQRGHEVTVVVPDVFWYSGLATGMLSGLYEPDLDQIDVAALVARGGGRVIRDRVVGLDPKARVIQLAANSPLPYDILSVTLGSEPPAIAGAEGERIYTVKPIRRLWELRQDLEHKFAKQSAAPALRIVIAGAGVTGCEIAANIAHLAATTRGHVHLTVMATGDELLEQIPKRAARKILSALEGRGVSFRRNAQVIQVVEREAVLADGSRVPFDAFINATGLQPSRTLRTLGLPLDARGGLIVDDHLRSVGAPEVYGAGDCISLRGHPLPSVGVYAIREAPVVFHNLMAAAEGGAPRKFRPQRRYLFIMNLGDGTGLAVRGPWYWHGKAAFRLKDWIDRRFLREYQSGDEITT